MKFSTITTTSLLAIGLLLNNSSANAFDFAPPPPPMYQGLILPLFPNGHTVPFSGQSGASRAKERSSSTLANGNTQLESNATALSMALPVAKREQMAQVYLQSFDTYKQLERKLALPSNDVAGSVAAFIAGNYMALNHVVVPDPHFQRMVTQLRGMLGQSAGYNKLAATDKRRLYEQTAMVGTFMAVAQMSLQKSPNPAVEKNFRDTAKNNLESVLKVPAEQVRIDDQGLHIGTN